MSLVLALLLATAPAGSELSWSVYGHLGASVYVSGARLIGGTGGGIGLQLSRGPWLAEAEVALRSGLGAVVDAQLGWGLQREGTWAPAVLVTLSVLGGDQTSVLTEAHPLPVRGPAFSLGLELELLRFVHGPVRISALQLGAGLGSDFPGVGLSLRVCFTELGITW